MRVDRIRHLLECLIIAMSVMVGVPAVAAQQHADLVLVNGNIITVDEENPAAQALAVDGDRILAVGGNGEISELIGPSTEVIDLQGRLVVPGFIEGHGHFMGLGQAKLQLDLTTPTSWAEIVSLVESAVAEAAPGDWILGRGWHQEKWEQAPQKLVEGNPVHEDLSRISPDNPVLLTHASGHAGFANARAMELAGIDADAPDPEGGEIVRDEAGQPTGLLRETAQRLVGAALERDRAGRTEQEAQAELRRAARLAAEEALSKGVTSFHDAGVSFETVEFYRSLVDDDALPLRLYVMVRGTPDELAQNLARYRVVGYGDNHLTVRAIKRQLDGALGSHGAWMLEPYEDLPRSTGLALESLDDLRRVAEIAAASDYQLNTHAIGDRANREVLDIYESIFQERPDQQFRWRIEHAQHLHPDDIERFGELDVIAAIQGVHATSDAPWVPEKIGDERAESGAYVWRDLWDSGAVVANGTDVPVEDIDPIASFFATVSRRLPDGSVFYPEQRLTREEALLSYTLNNAYAAFEEDIKGSLTPGKLADIVVLSEDILNVPEDRIRDAKVVLTILGGEVVYSDL